MKRWIKYALPSPLRKMLSRARHKVSPRYARDSYSQEGEDLIMEHFLFCKPTGFYVDVGAHHPKKYSNTYRLYRRGWRGINIDANPGSMAEFRRVRPRDINVEGGVGAVSGELTFYVFKEPAVNTFDKELALQRVKSGFAMDREVQVAVEPLSRILDRNIPEGVRIDMLTVDVEGSDFEVLQSNDWDRYSPDYILIECLGAVTLSDALTGPIATFLAARQYGLVAKTVNTVVFKLSAAKLC
jgi:FkbM family methyltransferase